MLGIAFVLYFGLFVTLNIPAVQRLITTSVTEALSQKLGAKVTIGQIEVGWITRIIINNLHLYDQSDHEMLKVSRLSANFDLLPLFNGKIAISNVQLFGFDVNINKPDANSKPNFQFVLDAFAAKDTTSSGAIDLRINSLLLRRGRIAYDVLSAPVTPGKFNPSHIQLRNIIANLSIKALTPDSVHASVKRFSVEEAQSGFELKKLSLKVVANQEALHISNFSVGLPATSISMDTISLSYNGLASFEHFADEVDCRLRLLPSSIALHDFSAFVPAFQYFKEPIKVEASAGGTLNNLHCHQLSVYNHNNHFNLRGDVLLKELFQPSQTYVAGNLSHFHIDRMGIAFIWRNLIQPTKGLPAPLQQLETVDFMGQVSGHFTDLTTHGKVRTNLGSLQTNMKLNSDKEKGTLSYVGELQTKDFELGKFLLNKSLGKVTFNLHVNSLHHAKQRFPFVTLKGTINAIDYNQYNYENISLDGIYKDGGFNGKINLDDTNGSLQMIGSFNTASAVPTFNFYANIAHLYPNRLHLTKKHQDADISLKIKANFTGGNIDEMNGEINIDSLHYVSPEKQYHLDNFNINAYPIDGREKRLTIHSNFLRGSIEGDYAYQTLPKGILNIMSDYLPSLIPPHHAALETQNDFSFDFHLYNTDLLNTLFDIPLQVYTHSTLKGYFNGHNKRFRIEGYFPRLRYNNRYIESGVLLCHNSNEQFNADLRFNNRKQHDAVNLSLQASAKDDKINADINWGNSSSATYSGRLSASASFEQALSALQENTRTHKQKRRNKLSRQAKQPFKTIIEIKPTQVILNDTLWQVHPSRIELDSGRVHIRNFNFNHANRHLRINGTLSSLPTDTVHLNLEKINIGYVFDIANLGVNFQGEATGPVWASSVLDKPVMKTDLSIRNLGINNGLLGDAKIHGEWHHQVKGIYLDADIRERDVAHTHVNGYIYPIKPTSGLDLKIKANGTNMKFIHYYMESITSEFKGRAYGDVHLFGKFKELTMQGKVNADALLKVDVLGTTYTLKDSILIEPSGLTFANNRIFDTQGHQGKLNGYLRYRHFQDLRYRFDIGIDNMLVLNTAESPDFPFYGHVLATGNASLQGNQHEGLNIHLGITTNPGSTFTFIKDNVGTALSNQFVTFVDRTPRRAVQDSVQLSIFDSIHQKEAQEQSNTTDIRLNMQIDATPDAQMRIIMDPRAGDYISGRGSGNLRAEFYNKGDIKLFGNYNLSQGVYKFSLQEVIRKDFTINSGSSIAFNGDPLNANLNIRALYTVNSASLNDLLPATVATNDYITQTKVKVNCIMDLSGQLTAPTIKLGLELPNERDEVQALVRNYIPTEEQVNMQILYLLSLGRFYMPDNVDATQNSNMMSSVLSSTLSGQLNNALSNIINNNNWNIGTNLSTGDKGWTDMEIQGMLSGQLLNNRLLINGNFGYRENPLANTNFVGDFEAEWLVNRSGDIRLKAYNETNDRYYTRTNLTTQGVGIIFKKDFYKWNELFFWNRWRMKRALRLKEKADSAKGKEKEKAKAEAKRKQNTN